MQCLQASLCFLRKKAIEKFLIFFIYHIQNLAVYLIPPCSILNCFLIFERSGYQHMVFELNFDAGKWLLWVPLLYFIRIFVTTAEATVYVLCETNLVVQCFFWFAQAIRIMQGPDILWALLVLFPTHCMLKNWSKTNFASLLEAITVIVCSNYSFILKLPRNVYQNPFLGFPIHPILQACTSHYYFSPLSEKICILLWTIWAWNKTLMMRYHNDVLQ